MRKIAAGALVLLLLTAVDGFARGRRDPLNPAEITELRDTAQEPDRRLLAFVRFIRTRADSLEKLRTDPRFTDDRLGQIHDLLDDITTLIDELDDNIDTYDAHRGADLRKPLKSVIELNTELQGRLRALAKTGVATQAKPDDAKQYAFVLQNAMEAVDQSLDAARQTLQVEEERIKAEKEAKKKK
jgi:hypothetical protein